MVDRTNIYVCGGGGGRAKKWSKGQGDWLRGTVDLGTGQMTVWQKNRMKERKSNWKTKTRRKGR